MNQIERSGIRVSRLGAHIAALFFLFQAGCLAAQETPKPPQPAAEKSQSELTKSIEAAIGAETDSIEDLRNRLVELEFLQKVIFTEINAYQIQNSSHGNLLLLPNASVQDLEKALGENRSALKVIDGRIADLGKRRANTTALMQQNEEQIELSKRQRREIDSGSWKTSEKRTLDGAIGRLLELSTQKYQLLDKLYVLQNDATTRFEALQQATTLLSDQFEQQVKQRVKQALFQRRSIPLKTFDRQQLLAELKSLGGNLGRWFQRDFWLQEGFRIKESGTMPLITLLIFLVAGALLIERLRRFLLKCEADPSLAAFRWRLLCLALIRRSVYLLGAAVVLLGYDIIQFPLYRVPTLRLVVQLLLIWVMTRWALDFLRLYDPGPDRRFWTGLVPHLRALAVMLRLLATIYMVLLYGVGTEGLVLFATRLLLGLGLLGWSYSFWRTFRRARKKAAGDRASELTRAESFLLLLNYLIVGGGLVIEFAGFPALAAYWDVSWTITAAVVFWAVVLFHVLREWQTSHRKSLQIAAIDTTAPANPIPLFFIQAAWLLWGMSLMDGLVLAWSTNWEVFRTVYAFMSRPWAIGKISLSLVDMIYAFVILFFTYTLTHVGRYLLAEKVFVKSKMESGLQASIITISVYLLWGFGLILALGVLGVSATSLAVVFGALSIGIGFGVQNIFNNFISGIILLFERPIQVGDAVEVGGVLGEVRKINVRSTVVQTYDNASLIIPNSEFISSQVTNWSFKDQRLRRKVGIGVAYGSDVALVKKTLLEIVDRTPQVLKYPRPDVLFMEHGESTLDFVLRYWTTIDHLYSTSSDIHFEVDRLFRERGIGIAFPQRDIHIRSDEAKSPVSKPSGEDGP